MKSPLEKMPRTSAKYWRRLTTSRFRSDAAVHDDPGRQPHQFAFRQMRTTFLITLPLLVLGCGSKRHCCDCVADKDSPTPEVRLVKDSPTTFHFQWKEPLKEERIILVRIRKVNARGAGGGRLTDPYLMDEETHFYRFDAALHQPSQFRSPLFSIMAGLAGDHRSIPPGLTPYVEILPEHKRYDIKLPTYPYDGGDEILVEHPFKPYELGKPSKLVFTSEKPQSSTR